MFDYTLPVVAILAALAVAGCIIRSWVRKAPLRKAKAERNWFISTLVTVVDEQTADSELESEGGHGSRKNGQYYWAAWVDLGLAIPGSSTWQMTYAEGDVKPDNMTDANWQKLVALVKKFGRNDADGSVVVWVENRHGTCEFVIRPYDNKPYTGYVIA